MVLGRPIDSEVAMTGEITLTGQVLPVGGIKEKVLAARRAGITKVFLPDRNEADFSEIQEKELVEDLEVEYVDHVSTTLAAALDLPVPSAPPLEGDHRPGEPAASERNGQKMPAPQKRSAGETG
jgi:ATP-dependent Lon protease